MQTWVRRTAGLVVVAVGLTFIGVVIASRLFSVGPAFERMSDGFRPVMQPAPIAQLQNDLKGLDAVSTEFGTTAVPMLSKALGMTPEQFMAFMGKQYPAIATGMQQLPPIVTQFQGVVGTLDAEQGRFASADAIPTSGLPATTVPWGLLVAGIVLVGLGIVLTIRPGRIGAVAAVLVGALVIAVPLALSMPTKATAADTMNDHLKPVYTAQMLAGGKASLATVGAMGQQMQTQMLPDLAARLRMDPAQLQAFLQQNLPTTAAGIQAMPQALGRFQNLLTRFDGHLADYDTLHPVAFVPIVWTMIVGGIVTLLAGGLALVPAARKREQSEEMWAGLPRAA